MTTPIRNSPSGPVIATIGAGMQLRLVEATTTSVNANTIPTVPVVMSKDLTNGPALPPLGMLAPDPKKNYRATVLCDVYNPTTNVLASVELYIDASKDGLTWLPVASNSHSVGFGGTRQIRLDLPMQPGSSIGIAAGDAAVQLRARIGASANGGVVQMQGPTTPGSGAATSVGAVDFQFFELFGGSPG